MIFQFAEKVVLEICTYYDAELDAEAWEDQAFSAGEEHDVDILNRHDNRTIDIQFGDGSCTYQVPLSALIIIEDEEI